MTNDESEHRFVIRISCFVIHWSLGLGHWPFPKRTTPGSCEPGVAWTLVGNGSGPARTAGQSRTILMYPAAALTGAAAGRPEGRRWPAPAPWSPPAPGSANG